ncbi:NAD(P)/FAD-dependent oxidoreductase [Roseomonas sp. NAR14]|uniref:Thioredoxin reductase n=1 Tax=Roseomonas acroporae TaxID=2937791 RepID=A0A9X1YD32_9PROT|nr:NAD(P)/FAD-dependent oxidoreductase [Roseomonas acroporae]MCK8786785.1 NAD(P)/FAD-dependent oxidoreductase [Roseomonas acroporae]
MAAEAAAEWDAVVIGGGPAGLSAALVLGRCRRRVLLCDAGDHRNDRSRAMHGFLTRDGTPPAELRALGRAELRRYPGIELRDTAVTALERTGPTGFTARLADGATARARLVLLATGVTDVLPDLPGLAAIYGTTAWVCPICDGWEHADQPLAVYGRGREGYRMALEIRGWTADLALCTDGPAGLDESERGRLARNGIALREERIATLESESGRLRAIRFATGDTLPRAGLFLAVEWRQGADFAERLGCAMTDQGCVAAGRHETTDIPGLFVAGDASRGLQLAAVAVAQGVTAAFEMNAALLRADLVD